MTNRNGAEVAILSASLFATAVWILSTFLTCGVVPVSGYAVGIGYGSLWLESPIAGDDSAVQWFARIEPRMPSVGITHETAATWEHWTIPLWPAVALALVFAVQSICRRPRPGRCGKCGYDRSGINPASVCPECGRAEQQVATPDSPP